MIKVYHCGLRCSAVENKQINPLVTIYTVTFINLFEYYDVAPYISTFFLTFFVRILHTEDKLLHN